MIPKQSGQAFEVTALKPPCDKFLTFEEMKAGYYQVKLRCLLCDEREQFFAKDLQVRIDAHRCMPKCRHGKNVLKPCWKCEWYFWQ